MNAVLKRGLLAALSIAFMAGGGCRTLHSPPAVAATGRDPIRVNCYSLLHQLLNQQKNVDKLLLVKMESAELRRLIKGIASASASGASRLEEFAANDATVNLKNTSLPPGEVATREAITRTKTRELLVPFDSDFELNLLVTQAEALSYAQHLAEVAAENEKNPARSKYLSDLGSEMKALHQQTRELMRRRKTAS